MGRAYLFCFLLYQSTFLYVWCVDDSSGPTALPGAVVMQGSEDLGIRVDSEQQPSLEQRVGQLEARMGTFMVCHSQLASKYRQLIESFGESLDSNPDQQELEESREKVDSWNSGTINIPASISTKDVWSALFCGCCFRDAK